jgi:hypothetical protein
MEAEITPIDLRDYATSLGWHLVREALKDGLYVLNSPENDFKQLIFPKDVVYPNDEQVSLAVEKLSRITGKSRFTLIEEIREVNDDVVSLRYFSENKTISSLSFEGALGAIEATKQLILSAASSVINPAIYHPRLSRSEPNDLLKKTRFRHTQEGSFILKISCPIEIGNPVVNLFGETIEEPFARKTFALINESSYNLLNSIESDNEPMFISEIKNAEHPRISYNFCDALLGLYDNERELPFELGFNWSRNSRGLPKPNALPKIKFPYSLKPKIESIKGYLKPLDDSLEDVFIGTVESLSGNIDNNGKRYGEVKLSILLGSDIVNAKANLRPEDYYMADQAHMSPGSYVKIKGKLQPGKQVRSITDIVEFGII